MIFHLGLLVQEDFSDLAAGNLKKKKSPQFLDCLLNPIVVK